MNGQVGKLLQSKTKTLVRGIKRERKLKCLQNTPFRDCAVAAAMTHAAGAKHSAHTSVQAVKSRGLHSSIRMRSDTFSRVSDHLGQGLVERMCRCPHALWPCAEHSP